jgi:hypothetical protein
MGLRCRDAARGEELRAGGAVGETESFFWQCTCGYTTAWTVDGHAERAGFALECPSCMRRYLVTMARDAAGRPVVKTHVPDAPDEGADV